MASSQALAFSVALVLSLFAVIDDHPLWSYILALLAGLNLFVALWS